MAWNISLVEVSDVDSGSASLFAFATEGARFNPSFGVHEHGRIRTHPFDLTHGHGGRSINIARLHRFHFVKTFTGSIDLNFKSLSLFAQFSGVCSLLFLFLFSFAGSRLVLLALFEYSLVVFLLSFCHLWFTYLLLFKRLLWIIEKSNWIKFIAEICISLSLTRF